MSAFTPPGEILAAYANVLVHFGLGDGAGIAAGDVVGVEVSEDAKPLLLEVAKAVWRAGGHLIPTLFPADDADWNLQRAFFELASDAQLDFFPDAWWRSYFASLDHYLMVGANRDPHSLAGVDPERIYRHERAQGPKLSHRFDRVRAGKLTWCLAGYPTAAVAAEAQMTLAEYWEEVIAACFLDDPDPVARLRESNATIAATVDWLNALAIDRLHVQAPGTDLWLVLGAERRWLGGGSVNIPSFEIYTSPDWRGTEGTIAFSEPLYWNGTVIEGIVLTFCDGSVTAATATRGEAELLALVGVDAGAGRVGEFSLTDGRISRLTRFMADTLYDENRGGPTGNTHIAVGRSYTETYTGPVEHLDGPTREVLGYNDSAIHVDIISTSDRTVTATLADGSERVIYAGGAFQRD
ncbi:aminopeptidase [Conexibacter sp. DBS9H8]|uniref:aminopeptidase n=1 Tax=Conexibacter sp. DBS9H8 TaxID=2937801 RepID=UPI00200F7F28|nr:aminopeptidase [Conexibacter sp. DBS9H8]